MIAGATRRGVLLGASGTILCRPSRAAEPARLLVAGPAGGRLDALAAALLPALTRGGTSPLEVRAVGGEDGVTGANQFAARFDGEGEGTPLLLLPGAAAAAWLAGDPRVQYDAARWLPLLCGIGSGVFASRRPAASARPGEPWRVAVPDPLGAATACLLGLDLLGTPALPVHTGDADAALRAGQVDAAFLSGTDATVRASAAGAAPVFSLGAPGGSAEDGRDPASPELPSLVEMLAGQPRDPALPQALRAVCVAALLDYALVVPALTPAPVVALWREFVARAVAAPELQGAPLGGVRSIGAPGCGVVQATISVDPVALLAYRQWLAKRIGYSPA